VAAGSTVGWSASASAAPNPGLWLSPELLGTLAETAAFLAERIFADEEEGKYTAEHFQDSPELDRLADIAGALRLAGHEVPAMVAVVLELARAEGWRDVSR
jgi:hypothetical protein